MGTKQCDAVTENIVGRRNATHAIEDAQGEGIKLDVYVDVDA